MEPKRKVKVLKSSDKNMADLDRLKEQVFEESCGYEWDFWLKRGWELYRFDGEIAFIPKDLFPEEAGWRKIAFKKA